MSIASELESMSTNISAAYDAVSEGGGTLPANKNLDNLPTAIGTISGGGGDPLDPEQVYRDTRPADWLVMPEIGESEDNVLYFLLMVAEDRTDDITITAGYAGETRQFGTTDNNGIFTAIDSLTTTNNTITLPMSAFSRPTNDGKKQLMMKVSRASGDITDFSAFSSVPSGVTFRHLIYEFKGKASHIRTFQAFGDNYSNAAATSLRFFNLIGPNNIVRTDQSSEGLTLRNCSGLEAVIGLDTSSVTNIAFLFQDCSSLIALPQLDTSLATSFSSMFYDCFSLKYIPAIDTSSGTVFSSMFYRCQAISTLPNLNTSNGQNFQQFLYGAINLSAIPDLDTSSATNISNMFSGCYSLNHADLTGYDFSSMGSSGWSEFIYQAPGQLTIELGDTFGSNGIQATGSFITSYSSLASTTYPLRIKINKTDAILPLAANATTVFGSASYVYVYVPDALLATYKADTYWATLGTRLKGFSELPS